MKFYAGYEQLIKVSFLYELRAQADIVCLDL